MRRGIWVGAAVLVAAAAAIPVWLVLDDGGGERRAAALQQPTASGNVGKLTLVGSTSGMLTMPVQSFTWGMSGPTDPATGQLSGKAVHKPLRILKQVDASSPMLFRMLTSNENITSASLELQGLDAAGSLVTYMTYTLSDAHVVQWQDGKREELQIYALDMTTKLGIVPKGGKSDILMSVPSITAEKLPLQDFVTSVKASYDPATGLSGKRQHQPVMVVQPLHATWPSFLAKLQKSENLGQVTIELQRVSPKTGVPETYATYTYGQSLLVSLEDSAAAGSSPTQQLEFIFQTVNVTVGGNTADDALATQ